MEIKLKNIYFSDRMSRETYAFEANLYINNYRAGVAYNEGHGGSTFYRPANGKGLDLIKEAEAYCKTLPDKIYEAEFEGDQRLTVAMDLVEFIDGLIHEYVIKKDLEKHQRAVNKNAINGVVFGIPDKQYKVMSYKKPLELIFKMPGGIESVKRDIQNKVLPFMDKEDKILNTNIPPEVIAALEIPIDRMGIPKKSENPIKIQKQPEKRNKSKNKHQRG